MRAPGGPGLVEAARREANVNHRFQIEEEPTLGADAFSAAKGWTVIVVAHRNGAAMVLEFQGVAVERAALRSFAARVLDAL